ncbi:hypothetical protein AB1N83_005989 [Pleurotus pulmonarius]
MDKRRHIHTVNTAPQTLICGCPLGQISASDRGPGTLSLAVTVTTIDDQLEQIWGAREYSVTDVGKGGLALTPMVNV